MKLLGFAKRILELYGAKKTHLTDEDILDEKKMISFHQMVRPETETIKEAFNKDLLKFGRAYESLGGYKAVFDKCVKPFEGLSVNIPILPVKRAGETQYTLPERLSSLAPILKRMIEDFERNNDAFEYHAILTYRRMPLKKDQDQIGNDWHTHRPTDPKILRETMGLDERVCQLFDDVDPNYVQTEYLISDEEPTLIQSKKAPEKLRLKKEKGGVTCNGENLPFRQAEKGEIVRGDAYSFHRAASYQKDDDKERNFLLLMFYPVKKTARRNNDRKHKRGLRF